MMSNKILLIEDDLDLGEQTACYLRSSGFDITWACNGQDALLQLDQNEYGLMLVDIQMPDMDGFDLVKYVLQKFPQQRFIFLTARDTKESKIKGLKLGGEDYVTKPFDVEELSWRIHNIINRNQVRLTGDLYIGDMRLSQDQRVLIFQNGHRVTLTEREFEVWKYFAFNTNRVLKREEILLAIWGENDYFLGRSLDVFVSRIRKLLCHSNDVKLETVYKVGFLFRTPIS